MSLTVKTKKEWYVWGECPLYIWFILEVDAYAFAYVILGKLNTWNNCFVFLKFLFISWPRSERWLSCCRNKNKFLLYRAILPVFKAVGCYFFNLCNLAAAILPTSKMTCVFSVLFFCYWFVDILFLNCVLWEFMGWMLKQCVFFFLVVKCPYWILTLTPEKFSQHTLACEQTPGRLGRGHYHELRVSSAPFMSDIA